MPLAGAREGHEGVGVQELHHPQHAVRWHSLEQIEARTHLLLLLRPLLLLLQPLLHLRLLPVLLLVPALQVGQHFLGELRLLDDGLDEGGGVLHVVGDADHTVRPSVVELTELMQDADVLPADVAVALGQRLHLERDRVHNFLFHFQFFYQQHIIGIRLQQAGTATRPFLLSFLHPAPLVSLLILDDNIQRWWMSVREALLLVLLVAAAQALDCTLENCDECDWSTVIDPTTDSPSACLTCHGWYEASWDTALCVLSARLIILCIVMGLLFIAILICSIFKIQDYRAKYTDRPTNIESLESNAPEASEEELRKLSWQHSNVRINDTSRCNICEASGGSVRLTCGHVFHGDCICWELRQRNRCPVCSSTDTGECTVHCIKCLSSFIKCRPELYVDIKKRKSRVCEECSRKE